MLEDARLRVRAVEQRHVGELHALAVERPHLVDTKRASSSSLAAA
jgi:hypothetical protein